MVAEVQEEEKLITDSELMTEIEKVLQSFKQNKGFEYEEIHLKESLYHTGDRLIINIIIVVPDEVITQDQSAYYTNFVKPIIQAISDNDCLNRVIHQRQYIMTNIVFKEFMQFQDAKWYWGIR